jgi:thiol-disulfide isomerase/thioredoxin
MGKAERNRRLSAREKIAAQQAAARRAELRRRGFIAGGAVVVVIAIVVALIVVKGLGSNSSASTASPGSGDTVTGALLPASVDKDVTTVPTSALNTVGTGSVLSFVSKPLTAAKGGTLTSGGKPEMLYIGAEFCPYCAAMRWSMAVALSRFGTLSPLHGTHSSSTDTDPNTPTLTFYKSSYTSPYLTFTPVENETRSHATLQNTTKAQQTIWAGNEAGGELGYPFIDFGGKYVITGPLYDPAVLKGLTWAQVAADLHSDPSGAVAQGALGTANIITAAICKMTDGKPGAVCTASGVVKASGSL